MSGAQQKPWSNNPNAPKIPYDLYISEKATFAGILIASVLYGILVVLFFQCMCALLSTANRIREGVNWGLVSYTVIMFSCATVVNGGALYFASISFIDNRNFPGVENVAPPGPLGYQQTLCSTAAGTGPTFACSLSYWLADGLLLYRCYIIFGRNLWVIAFPCLMYLATLATSITIIATHSCGWGDVRFILPNLSISVALNVLLTLMIVTRLVLHDRSVRAAVGSPKGISRLYKTIVTMLIESSTLYAVNSLLVIGLWAARSGASGIFLPALTPNQVIAPLLIVQRVANRSALTSDTIATGPIISFNIGSQGESTAGGRAPPTVYPMTSADGYGKNAGDPGVLRAETTVKLHLVSSSRPSPPPGE